MVHSDLKPSNIQVDDQGEVKLLDFGIAKMLDRERTGSDSALLQNLILTPDYASPEQLRGEPVSTSIDVYSLGVVFYELLAEDVRLIAQANSWDKSSRKLDGRKRPSPAQ